MVGKSAKDREARQAERHTGVKACFYLFEIHLFLGPLTHSAPRRDEMNEGRKNSSNTMPSVLVETLPSGS